jgi:polysaccharide export outer membrane protein
MTLLVGVLLASQIAAPPASARAILPQDVLAITVLDQPDLSNIKYPVDADGTVLFPWLGRIRAAGLTAVQFEADLTKRLADGYIRDPQVSVKLERATMGRVFVFGAVTNPGPYELTASMTLLEVLARAGYGTASEAVIVRTKGATAAVMPGENAASEVIKVNLRDFERDVIAGKLSSNVMLAGNDTIYVPRTDANRVFVTGEVRTPGAYSVPQGTTVLEVIQMAGGLTEHASERRIQLVRVVNGKRRALKAKMTDEVKPGDSIVVPERFF